MAVNRQKIWQINFNKYNAVGGGLKCCHPLNYKNTTVNQSPPHVGERGNPKLIPYETIFWATSGEPEAVEEVLRHYSRRIRLAALADMIPLEVVKVSLPMTSRKLYPNQININKLKENQLMGVSGEPPAPYGKYQNVFLTESEYAELKQEYPDCLERLIEEMSRYIASSGNDYVSHAATLYRWADREKKENPKKGIPDYSFKEGESL